MRILTFDIEEWFEYQNYPKGGKAYYLPILNSYLDRLLDLLEQRNIKATFFCLGMVAKEYPEIIKKIASRKHEIGCHSYYHKLVTRMDAKQFEEDTKKAVSIIEDLIGEKVCGYRAPAFSMTHNNKWAFDVLCDAGITYDSSVFPSLHTSGGYYSFEQAAPTLLSHNGYCLKEFPINMKVAWKTPIPYSGGGYFRLIPYPLVKKFSLESDYVMAYFHIRDLDAEQKKIISFKYFTRYYGIRNAFSKLEQYINDFDFISINKANQMVVWNKVPTVHL